MPWDDLMALVEPHYSKSEVGRKPVGLSIMLRVSFLQRWFALSDPAAEDALCQSSPMSRFAGVDLGRAPARTRRRSGTSATYSKSISYAARCWIRSTTILRPRDPHRHRHNPGPDHQPRAVVDQE